MAIVKDLQYGTSNCVEVMTLHIAQRSVQTSKLTTTKLKQYQQELILHIRIIFVNKGFVFDLLEVMSSAHAIEYRTTTG